MLHEAFAGGAALGEIVPPPPPAPAREVDAAAGRQGGSVPRPTVLLLAVPVVASLLAAALLAGCASWAGPGAGVLDDPARLAAAGVTPLRVQVLPTAPHDRSAFTEGLEVAGGSLVESTGRTGQSQLRELDPVTGAVRRAVPLPPAVFGEEVTVTGPSIWQLTWKDGVAYERDPATLAVRREVPLEREGWGICHDGSRLVTSDGTDELVFRDAASFAPMGSVRVSAAGEPVRELNELERTPEGSGPTSGQPTISCASTRPADASPRSSTPPGCSRRTRARAPTSSTASPPSRGPTSSSSPASSGRRPSGCASGADPAGGRVAQGRAARWRPWLARLPRRRTSAVPGGTPGAAAAPPTRTRPAARRRNRRRVPGRAPAAGRPPRAGSTPRRGACRPPRRPRRGADPHPGAATPRDDRGRDVS